MIEHRWGRRYTVDLPVRLISASQMQGTGRLTNLSISGGYVETTLLLTALTTVRIQVLRQDGLRSEVLEIPAFIVRQEGPGIGVEWWKLSPHLVPAAESALLANVASPPEEMSRRHS